jgi:hypothetical protein
MDGRDTTGRNTTRCYGKRFSRLSCLLKSQCRLRQKLSCESFNGVKIGQARLFSLVSDVLATNLESGLSSRDPNPGPNARSNYWQKVWTCRAARYRATYKPVKLRRSGSSPFCSPRPFWLRGGSSRWTRTNRTWRRDISWTVPLRMLCSSSNELMRDGLQL